MIHHLSLATICIWLAVIIAQVALAVLVSVRNTRKMYPSFTFFVCFAASKSLVLLAIAASMSGYAYFYTYVVMSFASSVSMCFAVRELYRLTFGPRMALPESMWRSITIAIPASCVALSMVVSSFGIGWMTQALDRGEKMIMLSLCVVLLWMLAYARFAGVSWGKRSAEIALGFVLFLAVNSLTIFSRGTRADSRVAELFGLGSYLCALLWWVLSSSGVCVPMGAKEDGNTGLEGRP